MHDSQKHCYAPQSGYSSHLQRVGAVPTTFELPDRDWVQCRSLMRQIDLCTQRNWTHAAAVLEDRLNGPFERAPTACRKSADKSPAPEGSRLLKPSARSSKISITLSDEFEGVRVDGANQTLSITTEPIVLEEIDLGPFEIRLHWDRISERRPYEVVALRTQPCGGIERNHASARQGRAALRRGRTSVD